MRCKGIVKWTDFSSAELLSRKSWDSLFGLPGMKSYEVIFATSTFYESCLNKFNRLKQTGCQLKNIKMTPLSGREPKAVTVIIHSEYVRVEDIKTWLSFKCTVKRGLELKDEDGIRTGAYRFYVHLHRDETSGDLIHLPPIIQLGAIRGYVFYPGQPKTWRKCGGNDHLAAECENVVCRNCNSEEHTTSECPFPRKCNLCGGEGHTFRACPQSYANRVKRPQLQQLEEMPMLTGGGPQADEDIGNDQASELQQEVVEDQTTCSWGEERVDDQPSQATTHKDSATVMTEETTGLIDGSEQRLKTQKVCMINPDMHLPQLEMETKIQEGIQEERASLSGSQILARPSTSQECRDLLDFIFPDLPTVQSKHIITLEDGGFSLLPGDSEDNATTPSESSLGVGLREALTSHKRQINTSTESSTGNLDLEIQGHTDTLPIPSLEEQALTPFQGIAQEKQKENNDERTPTSVWLPRKKKKKKVKL